MKFQYEHDMMHNYIIPQGEQCIAENDYRVHMLMENQIRGLLPCNVRKKDGEEEFRYDITSRQSMDQLYAGRYMGEKEIQILLRGLFLALTELKKYLLDISMLLLEPQIIYLDVETREPAFCYLPGYQGDITVSFRALSVYILEHLDAAQEKTVLLGYRIYRGAGEENYCLERLLKTVTMDDRETPEKEIKDNYSLDSEEKKSDVIESIGMAEETENPVQKKEEIPDRQKKEKKKQRKRREKSGKQKFTGKMFLIICFIIAFLMTLAAAWLWKLTATQTGGIILLLAGLLAYGCSLEPKKASAREEDIDYESYGLKEQPYIIEESLQQEVQYQKPEAEKPKGKERLGDTSVLYERDALEITLMLTRLHSQEQEYIVLLQDQYIVGKLNTEADFIIQDPSVSRIHAEIERRGGQYFVRDMNSTNGTFVNGQRLRIQECVPIQPGDVIAFARAEYQVERC